MEVRDKQLSYSPLQLIPQRPRFQSAAGQLAVQQLSSKAKSPNSQTTQSKKTVKKGIDSLYASERIQEKYKLTNSSTENEECGTDAETQQHNTSASLLQRQGILQHLAKFKQQAAAIRATTAAVQEWFEQQQEHQGEPLPADALRVLNNEAEKGLLHLLSTGLIPLQLELSPGLCEGPDAVLQSRPVSLFPADQKHTAANRVYVAPTSPPSAAPAAASPATVYKQQTPSDAVTATSQSGAALRQHAAAAEAATKTVALAGQPSAVPGAIAAVAPQPRGYEALLDDLSEHELLILKGKLVQETPQMLSFLRLAAPRWSIVSLLLSQLEAVCKLFKIPLAVIDGKAALQLAADTAVQSSEGANPKIGLPDLLCCLANLDELEPLFEAGSEMMEKAMAASDAGAVLAATGPKEVVDAVPAGMLSAAEPLQEFQAARNLQVSGAADAVTQEQQQLNAVTVAECVAGGAAADAGKQPSKQALSTNASAAATAACSVHRLQQPLLNTMSEARRSRDARFQQLQHLLRHHWHELQQQPRVVVHLPSMACMQQQQQQQGPKILAMQPCQQQQRLWRLLDLLHHQRRASTAAVHNDGLRNSSGNDATYAATCNTAASSPPDHSVKSNNNNSSSREICTPADVVLVVVADRPVCKPAQTYWMQLLKAAGFQDPERRIRFVEADGGPNLPIRLPLSASLLSSPKALGRCRQILIAHSSSSSTTSTTQPSAPLQQQQAATARTANKQRQDWKCTTRCPSAGLALPREAGHHLSEQGQHALQRPLLAGYIVPGCPSEHDLDVAVKLGLPLLGPTPQLAQVLASKIGCRSLFAAAGIRVPPGGILPHSSSNNNSEVDDTASWQNLLMAMCLQLLRWPQQQLWMLKLNYASGTAGLAVLDLQDMPGTQAAVQGALQHLQLQQLQQEQQQPYQQQQQQPYQQQQQQQQEPLDLASVPAGSLQQELQQMATELAQELHLGLLVVQLHLWQQQAAAMAAGREAGPGDAGGMASAAYFEALRQQGGVMEALLDNITCCPLVQLLIEPTGTVTVLATQDKILHGGFSSPGSSFPSSCPVPAGLAEAAQAAGEAAYTAGMLGYLQVSFICTNKTPAAQQQAQKGQQQQQGKHQSGAEEVHLWGCDVVPWPTADLGLFRLFDTAAQGHFNATTGTYIAAKPALTLLRQADCGSLQTEQAQKQQEQQQQKKNQQLVWKKPPKLEPGDKSSNMGSICSCYASLHDLSAVLSADHCASLVNLLLGERLGKELQAGGLAQCCSDFVGGFGQGPKLLMILESGDAASAVASGLVCCSECSTLDALRQLSVLIQQFDTAV